MGVNSAMLGKEVSAIIALGGNVGNVKQHFTGARDMLASLEGTRLLASSRLYRSPPMGPQDQPDYLNAVILLDTRLAALPLLHRMQSIELHFGRTRNGNHWGERTLDLDLIGHDDTQMRTHELTLPHPGMRERMFVLQPLCDILPDWRHPVTGETARDMLRQRVAAGESLLGEGEAW
jgi:2-amino-4-hydroxy-6-hydroxymethyldihydropteridine diphosphokinase